MTSGDARFPHPFFSRRSLPRAVAISVAALLAVGAVVLAGPANAAGYEDSVGLATVGSYSVLAGTTVTNTGSSVLSGDLGVSPGNATTGFPPGLANGATNKGNADAASAEASLTTAYLDAAGRTATGTSLGSALVGGILQPGVYNAGSSLGVSGAVTLDGQGDPNSVFIFQVGASMTTASNTSIVLIGAAQACNVFWQVGASATLGTTNTFVGTVMALTSVTVTTGTTVQGRALARNGAVTLDTNTFTSAACVSTPTTTTVTATPATTGGTTTLTATVTASGANAPTGSVTFSANGVVVGTAPVGANGVATLTVPAGTVAQTSVITAKFNGLVNYAASTSTATNLIVTAAVTPAVPMLPDTGPRDTTALLGVATILLALGAALMWVARSRRAGRHRPLIG